MARWYLSAPRPSRRRFTPSVIRQRGRSVPRASPLELLICFTLIKGSNFGRLLIVKSHSQLVERWCFVWPAKIGLLKQFSTYTVSVFVDFSPST